MFAIDPVKLNGGVEHSEEPNGRANSKHRADWHGSVVPVVEVEVVVVAMVVVVVMAGSVNGGVFLCAAIMAPPSVAMATMTAATILAIKVLSLLGDAFLFCTGPFGRT
jgi:hypothetical protein